jgi:hypothetical protein
MFKRIRIPILRLAQGCRERLPSLHFFAAKFAPTSTFASASSETEVVAGVAEALLPDAPGLWQLTDEKGARTTVRVKDQNGEFYAKMGSVAVPVQNLSGSWALIQ